MAMYDAELDAAGGYDVDDDDNLLTPEELDLWEMEVQAEIDAENDAMWDAYLAATAGGALTIIAASRHVDATVEPY